MQDVPWVPFHRLVSDEAQARLSVCRPFHGLQEAHVAGGVPTYAHNTGEVNFLRRSPLQLANTFACVLNRKDGNFLGLSKDELAAWHECLTWLRDGDNNPVLKLFGTEYEKFVSACSALDHALRSRGALPEGNEKARIRFVKHSHGNPREGALGDTLG